MKKYKVLRSDLHSIGFSGGPSVDIYIADVVDREVVYWEEELEKVYTRLACHKGRDKRIKQLKEKRKTIKLLINSLQENSGRLY